MKATFEVTTEKGNAAQVTAVGRNAWALSELVDAGIKGCTPISHPGPRWSAYVHRLRKDYGLNIETVLESHSGPFPGKHARYVLRTPVRLVAAESEAA
ncbi:MAG: hypothetical protein RIM72_01410 [Alphaproteobacteria bacterium]